MSTKAIKIWMIENDVTQAQIARELGSSKTLVWHVVHKVKRNWRVEKWLMDHGCPQELLGKAKK